MVLTSSLVILLNIVKHCESCFWPDKHNIEKQSFRENLSETGGKGTGHKRIIKSEDRHKLIRSKWVQNGRQINFH